jgi:hypothetical protein
MTEFPENREINRECEEFSGIRAIRFIDSCSDSSMLHAIPDRAEQGIFGSLNREFFGRNREKQGMRLWIDFPRQTSPGECEVFSTRPTRTDHEEEFRILRQLLRSPTHRNKRL